MYSKEQLEEKFNYIIQEVENGRALRTICLDEQAFNKNVFYDLLDSDSEKKERYARASMRRAEAKFESIEADYMAEPERDKETGKIDPAWVALQRLKIDSKKFEVAKLAPKKYGEKLDVTTDGEKLNITPIIGMRIINNDEQNDRDNP